MGMDVYGRENPDAYFRANVWSWRPLWDCTVAIAPWVDEAVPGASYNDGDGLDADDCKRLAKEVAAAIDGGFHVKYIEELRAEQDGQPDEACGYCNSTGIRTDTVGLAMEMPTKVWVDDDGATHVGWCNGCLGKGSRRPMSTWYGFEAEHFEEWGTFLQQCGGFSIH